MSLDKYQITNYGFLPDFCLTNLPPSWHHFQPLLDNLSNTDGLYFRSLVTSLPPYSQESHGLSALSDSEKRLVYSAITLIIQKYVWCCGKENLLHTIPSELGLPLLAISKELKMVPILNYAAVVLYNWTPKDLQQPICLENLKVNYKLIDNSAYEWFSIIHAAIEARGGAVLKCMLDSKAHMMNNDSAEVKKTLIEVTEALRVTNGLLLRMYDNCSPEDFWKFRFYFEGTNDTSLFPKGLQIEGVEHDPIVFVGISGAQSTLIQAFDAFFGVEHEGHGKEFLQEMRRYMPFEHKLFLEDLAGGMNIKDYVKKTTDKETLKLFEEAINRFTVYRQTHLRLVHDYVLQVINKKKAEASEKAKQGENVALYKEDGVGTGGTDAQKLLQQTILETRVTKTANREAKRGDLAKKGEGNVKEDEDEKAVEIVVQFDRRTLEDVLISVIVGVAGSYLAKVVLSSLMVY